MQAVLQNASVPETVVQEIVTQAAESLLFGRVSLERRRTRGQPAPLAVPETIEAVLAARIDRLPLKKRLLQTAAVIGMHVTVPLLQAVTDLAATELHTHLGHLQTAEFLYETGRLPASAYTFKHALTGGGLRVCSGATAGAAWAHCRVLEAPLSDRLAEQVERLAHHALRGKVWNKALTYCRQAGRRLCG